MYQHSLSDQVRREENLIPDNQKRIYLAAAPDGVEVRSTYNLLEVIPWAEFRQVREEVADLSALPVGTLVVATDPTNVMFGDFWLRRDQDSWCEHGQDLSLSTEDLLRHTTSWEIVSGPLNS